METGNKCKKEKNSKSNTPDKAIKIFLIFIIFAFIDLPGLMVFPETKILRNSDYDSDCLFPDFSPDERYIAHVEQETRGPPAHYNIFWIYDIRRKEKIRILERVFGDPSPVVYNEIQDEF